MDSSRDGVDSFPTYLHKGISRPPTLRISDNISKGFAPFFMPLIQTSASGSMTEAEICLIIIKLMRQQYKTATKNMLCRVTTNRSVRANGVQIEKGMSVEVISQTNNFNNSKDKEAMKQAFIRKYGIDVTKALPSLTFFQIDVISR